jgi:hypothetical protein
MAVLSRFCACYLCEGVYLPDGGWLLYVGGTSLYVSRGGAKPAQLSDSGFLAAAWA